MHRLEPAIHDVDYLMGLAYEQINRPQVALSDYRMCSSGLFGKLAFQHVIHLPSAWRRCAPAGSCGQELDHTASIRAADQ